MRVWLQKQKKKEETKAAAKAATPPVETTPAAAEVQPAGDAAEKPVDSVEVISQAEGASGEQAALENAGEAEQRAGSAALQPARVGLQSFYLRMHLNTRDTGKEQKELGVGLDRLARMNTIDAESASDHGVLPTFFVLSLINTRHPHFLNKMRLSVAVVSRRKVSPRTLRLPRTMLKRTSKPTMAPPTATQAPIP